MAWYAMVAGVIGAIVAAIPGLIDFFSITDPRAGKVGMTHLVLNAALVVHGSALFSGRTPCYRFCSPWWEWRDWW